MIIFFLDNDKTYTNLSVPYFQEGYVHYVVDAVFTLVIAIKKLLDEKCLNSSKIQSVCNEFIPFRNGKIIYLNNLFIYYLL